MEDVRLAPTAHRLALDSLSMLEPIDAFCGDLADNLPFYRDNYTTSYRTPPFPELTEDTPTRLPMLSTPDRAQSGTLPIRTSLPAYWDAYTPVTSRPRFLVTPPTSSLSMAHIHMVFSPSPLPVSQVPSLIFPEISPPSQGSGSTPFERQFVGEFSRDWNIHTQVSPVARGNARSLLSFSPTFPNAGATPSRTDYGPTSQDSQGAVGRVSLIDKFISAAADESATIENEPRSSASCQDRSTSTPLSDLSDLTSLPSSQSSSHFGGPDFRHSSPPTSPAVRRPGDPMQSKIQQSPNSGREPSPGQSTRSSSRSRDSDYQPARGTTGRKRKTISRSRDGDAVPIKHKRIRTAGASGATSVDATSSSGTLTRRQLPADISYHSQFSLLYLRFPVSSYLRLADGKFPFIPANSKRIAGIYNEPRDALDLYTPRFVKGCGATKVGICPICIESTSRGGKGEAVWLSMKFSAYKVVFFIGEKPNSASSYHLQYAHGISSVSARPFSPPVAFRTTGRPNAVKNERTSIQEGKCHKCKKWILVESIKNIDIKVKELYWWKHAAACHQGGHLEGDDDFFLQDDIYHRAQRIICS